MVVVVDDEPAGAPAERSPRLGVGRIRPLVAAQGRRSNTEAITARRCGRTTPSSTTSGPDTDYVYDVIADGANPLRGTFRTAPSGRKPFRFTSFGEPGRSPRPSAPALAVGPNTPNAAYVVDALGGLDRQPLFPLLNGDSATRTSATTRSPRGAASSATNMKAARATRGCRRPATTRTRSATGRRATSPTKPGSRCRRNGRHSDYQGNWYSFKVVSVGWCRSNNDDVCYQQGSASAYRQAHIIDPAANHDDYIRG